MSRYHFEGATPETLARAMVKRRPKAKSAKGNKEENPPKPQTRSPEKKR